VVLKWRSVLARERRRPPGFILPCKPVLSQQIPTGPEWIHELKWDGYRLIARREGGTVHLWSQSGRNWADAFPAIVAAIGRLKVESVVLDGEAVCLLDDGRPDFHGLRSWEGCKTARFIAFDLLGLNGEDLRRMPLSERRRRLADLLGGDDALWLSSHVQGAQGEALFRQACALNLEGIVSKRIDTPYRSGPFLGWRKIKCPGYARP
jgi:bifunctional non-homologous end joining protein LigD